MSVDLDEVYEELLPITHELGADVDELFWKPHADAFAGSAREFIEEARMKSKDWFRSLGVPPEWVQNPEWRYHEGRPMIFVGQLQRDSADTRLHDSATFFLFWDPVSGVTDTVIQIA